MRSEANDNVIATAYDKAMAYTNLIIVAGYVAYFAMWSNVVDHLPRAWMLLSGLLMTISAVTFVMFEVYKMATFDNQVGNLEGVNDARDYAKIQELTKQTLESHRQMYSVWKLFMCITVSTGVLAAGILVYAFAYEIFFELLTIWGRDT